MKLLIHSLMMVVLFLPLLQSSVRADWLWNLGYSMQSLSTEGGYNQFLSERYGASQPSLIGGLTSITYLSSPTIGFGLEYGVLSGAIKYTTLNGEPRENQMELQSTVLLVTWFQEDWELSAGYGSNQLTRTFYGYQDPDIVTDNIEAQEDTQQAVTTGTMQLMQVVYQLWSGQRLSWSAGGRYTISEHEIPAEDVRPAYDERGLPTTQNLDLGGLGFLTTLTYRF